MSAAILSMYALLLVSAGILPALQNISDMFPEIPYASITIRGLSPACFSFLSICCPVQLQERKSGERRSVLLGYGSVAMNIGLIVIQSLVGILVSVKTQNIWMAYLFCLIVLFFVTTGLKEPENMPDDPKIIRTEKNRIPRNFYMAAFMMFLYPFLRCLYFGNVRRHDWRMQRNAPVRYNRF